MTIAQKWIAGAVVAALALFAGSWFLLVSPKRSDTASLEAQTAVQLQKNQSLQTQLDVLKSQKKNLPETQAELAKLQERMPTSEAMPGFIRALGDQANKTGMVMTELTPSKAAMMSVATVTPPSTASSTTPSTTTTVPSTTTTLPSTTTTVPSTGTPLVGTTVTPAPAGQMYYIDSQLIAQGGYFQVERYINSLENMPRYVLVPKMNLVVCDSDDCAGGLTMTLTVRVFLMTDSNTIANTTKGIPNTGETTTGTTGTTTTTGTTSTTTSTGTTDNN